jgi:RHS repeat-associated protein
LGSVRLVIDSSGHVKNRYTYNPFGELHATETEENILNPFKYTGQYFDSETGLYYFINRIYDPYLSRFTAYDPFGLVSKVKADKNLRLSALFH